MCAFAQALEKHCGAESRIAPAMRPSRRGRGLAGGAVTPDMLSQGRGIDLVIEVKRSLPGGGGGRAAALGQLGRYDDDPDGWRRNPPTHDIVPMTHMSKSAQWADFLKDALKRKKASFNRKVSVVEYVRDSERATYMILMGGMRRQRLAPAPCGAPLSAPQAQASVRRQRPRVITSTVPKWAWQGNP